MYRLVSKYDSDKQIITIRTDNNIIAILREINIDNAAYAIKTATAMYQVMYNLKANENDI